MSAAATANQKPPSEAMIKSASLEFYKRHKVGWIWSKLGSKPYVNATRYKKIFNGLKALSSDNPYLLYSFYKNILKITDFSSTNKARYGSYINGKTNRLNAITNTRSSIELNPVLFESSETKETLASILIHEYSHWQDKNPFDDNNEGEAYGIEYFFTLKAKAWSRMGMVILIRDNKASNTSNTRWLEAFRRSLVFLSILYLVIAKKKSTLSRLKAPKGKTKLGKLPAALTGLTVNQARRIAVKYIFEKSSYTWDVKPGTAKAGERKEIKSSDPTMKAIIQWTEDNINTLEAIFYKSVPDPNNESSKNNKKKK